MLSRSLSCQTFVIIILILVELLIVVLQIIGLAECKQCLLFAKIFEIERKLDGGLYGWCYMLIANGLLSVICLLMLLQHSIFGTHLNSLSQSAKLWTILWVSISSVVTTCIVTIGWLEFCNTFKVVRCNHTPSRLIDWKSYTPKYSNCYNSYYYYTITEMGLLWCSACWIFLFLRNAFWRNAV